MTPNSETSPSETTPQTDYYDGIDADIQAAIDKVEAGGDEPEPVKPEPEVVQEVVEEPESELPQEKEAQREEAEPQEPKEPEKEAKSQIEPPQFFKKEYRERWSELDPEWQEYLTQYEKQAREDYYKKSNSLAEERKRHLEVIEPYRQQWAQLGLTPDQAVAQALSITQHLNQNPKETLAFLAQQYGIDFNESTDNDYIDPKIRELEQKVEAFEKAQLQQAQQQQAQVTNNLQTEISTFETAKDASGNLQHPYFQEVRGLMQPYVEREWPAKRQLSPQQIMKEAYEAAIWAHPPTREKLLQRERLNGTTTNIKETARAAKNRGVSINGAPGTSRQKAVDIEEYDSVDEAVEAAARRVFGGI